MTEEVTEPMRQSFLLWFISAMGWRYLLLIPLSALLAFIITAILVTRGRGWTAGTAILLVVPMPLLVGILGTIDGLIMSHMVIASSDVMPKPSAVAEGVSTALVTALVGLLLMVPSYALAVIGLTVRSVGRQEGKSD